jgi:hypothetical protein
MKRDQLLKAIDSVRAWVRDQPEQVEPFRLQPIPGLVVQVREGKSSNAAKCARYRDRRATRVATGVTVVSKVSNDTGPTRVATPSRPVSRPVSDTVSAPLGFPLASPSGSPPETGSKEIAVASEGSDRSSVRATTTRPRNHAEALTEPPGYVAELCRKDPTYAGLIQVHRMPWVEEPIRAWHEAGGDARPLELEANDGEVTAVVVLTARGYMKSDLVRVARYLRTTDRYRDKVLASSMTKAVVDIAMAELQERAPKSSFASDLVRRVEQGASRGPTSLGASLPKLASGAGE